MNTGIGMGGMQQIQPFNTVMGGMGVNPVIMNSMGA
jgi:hypothetical protein